MKKALLLTMSAILAINLFAGCSAPAPTPASSAATSASSTASTTSSTASAAESSSTAAKEIPTDPMILAESELPVKGIGKTISSDLKAKEKYTVACIVKNSTNPYMVSQLAGVKKAGEDMGVETILMAPAKADSVEEQIQIIENMLQKGVNAIIIHCVDSNGIMPGIRKAKEAGVPVVTIGTPAAEPTLLRTGVNYEETGYEVAKKIAETIGGKGKMIILEGPPGAQNAIERLSGIQRALKEYPEIEVVASQTANFKRTEGMQVTENLLQKYNDVNAIIGANDESALGAIQALKAAGLTSVAVGGFDGSVDASNAVKTGEMVVSYNTDPFGSGYVALAYIVEYLNDGKEPPSRFIPFPSVNNKPLITKESVEEYIGGIAWWIE